MAKREQEIRTLATREFRVATSEDGTRTLSGIIPYNSLSVDLGGFTELHRPPALSLESLSQTPTSCACAITSRNC